MAMIEFVKYRGYDPSCKVSVDPNQVIAVRDGQYHSVKSAITEIVLVTGERPTVTTS